MSISLENQTFDFESLNLEDLDVQELEHRLELGVCLTCDPDPCLDVGECGGGGGGGGTVGPQIPSSGGW